MATGAKTSHRNQEDGWGQSWRAGGLEARAGLAPCGLFGGRVYLFSLALA